MLTALRYYWITTRGYRLRPWASPYVRWRLETFFGGQMQSLGPVEFFGLIWREHKQLSRFLSWTAERRLAQKKNAVNRVELR